nr:hypothetical protein [Bradyrhizobium diazoefficiens]
MKRNIIPMHAKMKIIIMIRPKNIHGAVEHPYHHMASLPEFAGLYPEPTRPNSR